MGKLDLARLSAPIQASDPYEHIESKAPEVAKKYFKKITSNPIPRSSSPLSDMEKMQLAEFEKIIEEGQEEFFKVAQALLRINKLRLYRETHRRFEDYVKERWGHGKTWAYDAIDSAIMLNKMTVKLGKTPKVDNSSVLALLAGLSDEDMANVVLRATTFCEGGVLTAANVRKVKKQCELDSVDTR